MTNRWRIAAVALVGLSACGDEGVKNRATLAALREAVVSAIRPHVRWSVSSYSVSLDWPHQRSDGSYFVSGEIWAGDGDGFRRREELQVVLRRRCERPEVTCWQIESAHLGGRMIVPEVRAFPDTQGGTP